MLGNSSGTPGHRDDRPVPGATDDTPGRAGRPHRRRRRAQAVRPRRDDRCRVRHRVSLPRRPAESMLRTQSAARRASPKLANASAVASAWPASAPRRPPARRPRFRYLRWVTGGGGRRPDIKHISAFGARPGRARRALSVMLKRNARVAADRLAFGFRAVVPENWAFIEDLSARIWRAGPSSTDGCNRLGATRWHLGCDWHDKRRRTVACRNIAPAGDQLTNQGQLPQSTSESAGRSKALALAGDVHEVAPDRGREPATGTASFARYRGSAAELS
jgi:hypothetical protein